MNMNNDERQDGEKKYCFSMYLVVSGSLELFMGRGKLFSLVSFVLFYAWARSFFRSPFFVVFFCCCNNLGSFFLLLISARCDFRGSHPTRSGLDQRMCVLLCELLLSSGLESASMTRSSKRENTHRHTDIYSRTLIEPFPSCAAAVHVHGAHRM